MSNYVLATHRFTVDWGSAKIGFQEVSAIGQETDVISYETGDTPDGTAPMKSPGKTKYTDTITLTRGYFRGDQEMQDWLNSIRTDETARRTVIITLLDEQQQPVMTWTIYKAWPSKIEGVSLNAANSAAAIEKVELQHEGYDIAYL